jgi:hypothetical protein
MVVAIACHREGLASEPKIYVSGYGNVHYMHPHGMPATVELPNSNNSILQLREFTFFVDAAVSETVVASTELEIGNNGSVVSANYAYADVQLLDAIGAKVGKILVPFLSSNENKINHRQALMSQPFTAWNLAPVNGTPLTVRGFGWSDVGISLEVHRPLGKLGLVWFRVSVINGLGSDSAVLDADTMELDSGPTIRTRDGLMSNEPSSALQDNNHNKAIVASISLLPIDSTFDLGASYYQGKWDEEDEKNLRMWGVYANRLGRDWTLRAEYVQAEVEQEEGVLLPGVADLPNRLFHSTGDYGLRAWYVELSRVALRWGPTKWLRGIVRADDVDTNDRVEFTPFDRSRLTYGLEYQFQSQTRLRVEYQQSRIDAFESAPTPYVQSGGNERPHTTMVSMIFWF